MKTLESERFKLQLPKLVASCLQEKHELWSSHSSEIKLTLAEFSEKVSDILLSSLDRSQLGDPITAESQSTIRSFINALHLEDLYLATACAQGDNSAWEKFLKLYKDVIFKTAYSCCDSADTALELAESILSELFMPRSLERNESKIATYNGRGSLKGWLRAVISRAAIDMIRRKKRFTQLDPESREHQRLAISTPVTSFDGRHLREAENALGNVLKELPDKEKMLLNFYYYHNLSLKEIAVYFNVHEATISRWLDAIRKKIKKSVERRLKTESGLKAMQLKELWSTGLDRINLDLKSYIKQDKL